MNRKASVAKWIALAVVPLSLTAVLGKVGQIRRAEAATVELRKLWTQDVVAPASVQQLIDQGADVNARERDGRSALYYAAMHGSAVTKIILDQVTNVNAQDNWGTTALIVAAMSPDSETVQLLLSKGANPNLQARSAISSLPDVRYTALYWAQAGAGLSNVSDKEKMNSLKVIQLLKAAGAKE